MWDRRGETRRRGGGGSRGSHPNVLQGAALGGRARSTCKKQPRAGWESTVERLYKRSADPASVDPSSRSWIPRIMIFRSAFALRTWAGLRPRSSDDTQRREITSCVPGVGGGRLRSRAWLRRPSFHGQHSPFVKQ